MGFVFAVLIIILIFVTNKESHNFANNVKRDNDVKSVITNAELEYETFKSFFSSGKSIDESFLLTARKMNNLGYTTCIPKSFYFVLNGELFCRHNGSRLRDMDSELVKNVREKIELKFELQHQGLDLDVKKSLFNQEISRCRTKHLTNNQICLEIIKLNDFYPVGSIISTSRYGDVLINAIDFDLNQYSVTVLKDGKKTYISNEGKNKYIRRC